MRPLGTLSENHPIIKGRNFRIAWVCFWAGSSCCGKEKKKYFWKQEKEKSEYLFFSFSFFDPGDEKKNEKHFKFCFLLPREGS